MAASTIGAISSLAPTLGPTVGGWITDNFSWHWLFFVNLVPGVMVAVVVPMLVRIDQADFSLLKGADYLGIALMAVFLGSLEYTLEEGPRWGWLDDSTIATTAWISAITGVGFIWRSLTYANPVVDLRALTNRNFALGCLLNFVTGIGIFATIYLTPLFLGQVRGLSAFQIGSAVFATGMFQFAAIPVYAILVKRFELRWLMAMGLTAFALSMWFFTPITHEWGWQELLIPQALRGFGQQFAVAPIVTLSLGGLPPSRMKLASGLFNLTRNLGGAIGIALCGTILNNRTNLHFLRLAENLNTTNVSMNATLHQVAAKASASVGGDAGRGHDIALRLLRQLTMREAQTLSFSDAFLVVGICFVATMFLLPLLKKVAPPKKPSADAH